MTMFTMVSPEKNSTSGSGHSSNAGNGIQDQNNQNKTSK